MSAPFSGSGRRTEARRLKLVVQGDRMILRPSRFGLAMGLGALTGLLVLIYGLGSALMAERSHSRPSRVRVVAHAPGPGRTVPLTPTVPFSGPHASLGPRQTVPLTPLVPIVGPLTSTASRHSDPAANDPLILKILKAPVSPVVLGFCVFYLVSFLFHERIVLDRGLNVLMRGKRVVCKLSELTRVKLENYSRFKVMNELALILPDGRELSLLLFDGMADDGLKAAAHQIAEFARAPLDVKTGRSVVRR
jgi:hypothetical protein